jgi:hypothetical protein
MPKPWTHVDAGLHWQKWEVDKLARQLKRFGAWEPIHAHFDNRSPQAVEAKARRSFPEGYRKLQPPARKAFSAVEDGYIRREYRRMPARDLAFTLRRSRNSVIARANRLMKMDKASPP